VRRVLNPRWYAAARAGYLRPVGYPGSESYEMAVGFRPSANQLLKFGYGLEHESGNPANLYRVATIQFVTNFRAFGFAGH
jgi:hypothetical protein